MNKNNNDFLKKSLLFYKTLNKVRCSVLDDKYVIFGDSGFTHLIRKGRKTRPIRDRYRRLALLRYVPQIIEDPRTKISYQNIPSQKYGCIIYITLEQQVDTKKIKVILRKYGSGNIHFLSVMDRK